MTLLKFGTALASALMLAVVAASSAEAAGTPHDTIVSGLEFNATSYNQGSFAGTATPGPRNGLAGTWKIVVNHTPLGSQTCKVPTGGSVPCAHIISTPSQNSSFSLVTARPSIGLITGRFADQWTQDNEIGNEIVQVGADTVCGTQHYTIKDKLLDVGPAGSPQSGWGSFNAELWHYRYSFWGRCITYSAFVKGTVALYY